MLYENSDSERKNAAFSDKFVSTEPLPHSAGGKRISCNFPPHTAVEKQAVPPLSQNQGPAHTAKKQAQPPQPPISLFPSPRSLYLPSPMFRCTLILPCEESQYTRSERQKIPPSRSFPPSCSRNRHRLAAQVLRKQHRIC